MRLKVFLGWHGLTIEVSFHESEELILLRLGVVVPSLEIEDFLAPLNVTVGEPRVRCDLFLPGPLGVAGMTVVTGFLENILDLE